MTTHSAITLTHSWPIYEAPRRLPILAFGDDVHRAHERPAAGLWSCRLADDGLTWSHEVYQLFGIPVEERITRSLTLSRYEPSSRAAMEALRTYALRHNRGFTLDMRIYRADDDMRWVRLTAVPLLCDGRPIRLVGTKQDVTAEYEDIL